LSAPLSALPPPSSQSVTLSPEEAAQIEAAIVQAREALKQSNEEISKQEKLLTRLWLLSGVLAIAVITEAVAYFDARR
jgi:hypothetical protein